MKQFLLAVVFLSCLLGVAITQPGGITPIDLSAPLDQETSQSLYSAQYYALFEIGNRIDSGDLQFDSVTPPLRDPDLLKAGKQIVAGTKWYLTIRATDIMNKYFTFQVEVVEELPFMPQPWTLVNVVLVNP